MGEDDSDGHNLKTSRLELRPPRLEDASALFCAYTADPEVTKYLPWAPHKSLVDTEALIANRIAKWKTGEGFTWIICIDVHSEPIGMMELRPEGSEGSIGFVLARRWWNCGVMSEALGAVTHHARTALNISILRAWCDADNLGSARVLEKNGFVLRSTGPGPLAHSAFAGEIRPALFYERSEPRERAVFYALDHVQLAMPAEQEDAARAFYVGVLGFEEVPKPDALAARGGAWFRSGEVNIHLGVDPVFIAAKKAHPAFRCSDYEALLIRLAERGIRVTPDPLPFNGKPHCYVEDPFGNRIEFIAA